MESNQESAKPKERNVFIGVVLFVAAVALAGFAAVYGNLPGWMTDASTSILPITYLTFYPLAYVFAALSLAVSAALVLVPRSIRVAFRLSAIFAALSALFSVAYAVGWWIVAPEMMVWQDYACIVLQALACALVVVALVKRGTSIASRALLACFACIVVSTLAFLFTPLFEPAYSVLMRTLSLASPMAMLVFSEAYASEQFALKEEH